MAVTREKKEELVNDYARRLAESHAVIFANYRGLSVSQTQELRRRLGEKGCTFQVAKNTLLVRALTQLDMPVPEELLTGPTAVGYLIDDIGGGAKALSDFARESRILEIKGGLIGVEVMDASRVSELADLPSREELLGRLVSALQGPMVNLAGILQAPLRDLVYVLQARAEQEQSG